MVDWDDARASSDLLHLLTCPSCRDRAIDQLINERSTPLSEEETKEKICAGAWDGRSAEEALELRRCRREEVEGLFSELMGASAVGRLRLLASSSFLSRDLLDHLLEESHASQLADPSRAAELARLAARLASAFMNEGAGDVAPALSRAYLLDANARRRPLSCRENGRDGRFGRRAGVRRSQEWSPGPVGGEDRVVRRSGHARGEPPAGVRLHVGGVSQARLPGQRFADQATADGLIQGGSVRRGRDTRRGASREGAYEFSLSQGEGPPQFIPLRPLPLFFMI
jgi:hypothetical protein